MAGGILLNEDETAVAGWVCKNCHKAGRTTNTLPGAAGLYIPIQKDGRVFGVIGIDLKEGAPIKPNDKNVLHVILDETAVVLKAQMITDIYRMFMSAAVSTVESLFCRAI